MAIPTIVSTHDYESDYRSLASDYNSRALEASHNGDYDRAVRLGRLALHLNPHSDTIRVNLLVWEAKGAAEAGAYQQAVDAFHSAMQLDDDYRSLYWQKLYTYWMTKASQAKDPFTVMWVMDKCVGRPANNDGLCG